MRRLTPFLTVLVIACGQDAEPEMETQPATEAAADPAVESVLAQIRAGTDKYKDVAVAEQEGYIRDPGNMCVAAADVGLAPETGRMGVHYFRPDLLGITNPQPPVTGTDGVIDLALPEILVYEPQADGSLQLVAAEYLVFQDAWEAAGNTAPPTVAGQPFFSMADDPATERDEAHGFAPHYELHVWVHRDNPSGVFAEFNPNVTCEHHQASAAPHQM